MSSRATHLQDPAFESWLDTQLGCSAKAMLSSISPVSIVKDRSGFGQTVRPIAGAIVASPVLGSYDPDPDYFFHWFRDSAVVIDALRLLYVDRRVGDEALQHLRDFTGFSLALNGLDGRAIAAVSDRRSRVAPDLLQYLRDDAELASVHGTVSAETRVNPDGTLDILRWPRPQHDGPALRALALLRWVNGGYLDPSLLAEVGALIRLDLDFTLRHWPEPSYDIWEEESGHHYYTLRVSAAALAQGAAWLEGLGDTAQAQRCREASQAALTQLDGYWVNEQAGDGDAAPGYYRSRVLADGRPSAKALDIAVILSAIHALGTEPAHGPADPRMQATLARLEALFDAAYPINHGRPEGRGPAMGRYAGDVYYSGGAYYFSTLGAAEFCFRAAAAGGDARHQSQWTQRGDAYLATVRAYTPANGDLSEQFDQRSGVQTSAKQLAWSHAAFISCVSARRVAAAGQPRRQ
ncbi:oligosaccharide amylase [Variovorax sp. PBS-H4]|uniref:glycoside hydrolase family 15 protein n=1 Tax=Variovorax sp. PBS-H4 TaxID=434008 RepID=UPI0013188C2F|nr:glycoside hydrolase family 15 protein [Variovorax sp. PBS-H4]VTU30482.1 oligosaccharide amylase [Variovorax sp. PBS-H4]